MILSMNDILLMILIISVLWLVFSPEKEKFTNETELNTEINKSINNRYSVNFTNMRNLSNLISNILNNQDTLNLTTNNTKLFDLNTTDTNINKYLKTNNKTIFKSDVSINGQFLPADNNLKFKKTNVLNNIKINPGKYNDIFPTGSIILFYTKRGGNNIPYGWVPCDGSYYDSIKEVSNNQGKDEYGNYTKFYNKSINQPEQRNLDLAHTWETYNPTIQLLVELRNIGLDNYFKMTGVKNDPFTEDDLKSLKKWDANKEGDRFQLTRRLYSFKKRLLNDPIKRDYIYIRKII